MVLRNFAATLGLIVCASPAAALTEADLAAIAAVIGQNRTAVLDERPDLLLGVQSDAIMQTMANLSGVTIDEQKASFVDLMTKSFAANETTFWEVDLDKLEPGVTEAGRDYVLAPFETQITLGDGRVLRMDTQIVLYEDDDAWYWSRIDNALGLNMLHNTYPDMRVIKQATPNIAQMN